MKNNFIASKSMRQKLYIKNNITNICIKHVDMLLYKTGTGKERSKIYQLAYIKCNGCC